MKWLGFILLLIVLIPSVAGAEEYIYAPDNCDFTITFPSEPYTSKRCNPLNPENCQKITSYTKVFDMQTSINFSVTCNRVDESMFERYTIPVMETALTAMASEQGVKEYQTGSQDLKSFKQAVLLGAGQTGKSEKLYIAQIWISKNSLMTLESELIGDPTEEQQDHFARILQTVSAKSEELSSGNTSEESDLAPNEPK